jgi:hypothetical protein
VLFIVVKNRGGVPVAVKRIVNPQFPVEFKVVSADLLVPGTAPDDALSVEVQMNTHGNAGKAVKGDLGGDYPDPVYAGSRGVHVVIDKQL